MRVTIAVILGMALVAAAIRVKHPTTPEPTRIAIYDRAGGVNISTYRGASSWFSNNSAAFAWGVAGFAP